MNISLIALLTSKDDAVATLQMELKKLAAASRAEEGCLQYDLNQCLEPKNQFAIVELWESQEALDKHRLTPHYKYFIHITPALLCAPIEHKILIPVV